MIFEHYDTLKIYDIPDEKCNIDEFIVNANTLTLSTGERVVFNSKETAACVWCFFDECFRKGWHRLFLHEKAGMSYSMYKN